MTLYVVATPIGNLEDITLRALRVLRECDAVVAEDTRRTRALLTAHGISRPLVSLPAYAEQRRIPALLQRLEQCEVLALVTDAGTPVVSDPGATVIRATRAAGYPVIPIPGPSAVVAALAATGMGEGGFVFLGFLPRSRGKMVTAMERGLAGAPTVVFYESPLRLARTLRTLADTLGDREVVVARELTKVHETIHVGRAAALAAQFGAAPPRGECTVLVGA